MFCKAPFTSQALWANGNVTMCCNDTEEFVGSLEDEWNSASRKEAQAAWLSGLVPDRCKSCIAKVDQGDVTLPEWYDDIFPYEITEQTAHPEYLHFSPSNKCNLACRMCNGKTSSTYSKVIDGCRNDTENDVIDYIRTALPNLKHYVFHGGEPMMYDRFVEVLDILAERADDLYINVITNGMSLKSRGVDVVPLLARFKRLKITLSFDSIPEVNDYLRHFTKSETVIDNYNRLCRELPHAEMQIHSITTNASAMNIPKLIDFLHSGAFDRIDDYSHYMVTYPPTMNIANMPPSKREELLDVLSDIEVPDTVVGSIWKRILPAIPTILSETPFDMKLWADYLKETRLFNDQVIDVVDVTNLR